MLRQGFDNTGNNTTEKPSNPKNVCNGTSHFASHLQPPRDIFFLQELLGQPGLLIL